MALEFASGFIVSSLLQELVDKIKASAADTISLAYSTDMEEELKTLEASYVKALSLLGNIDGWDLITSKPHRDWVADIRRACYGTEDFIEHLKLEILKKIGDASFMRSYWLRWGVSRKLRDLKSNLDRLSGTSDCFLTSNCRPNSIRQHSVTKQEPLSLPDDDSFRRKQEKESIVEDLLQSDSSKIVLIESMFGIGKTTLAQFVKNDLRIQSHFDHKLWVSVSGDFDLRKALCSIIIDLQLKVLQDQELGSSFSPPFLEQLSVRMFHSFCKGSSAQGASEPGAQLKLLVVLDDLHNFTKPQDWQDFQSLFLDPSFMFNVLITTRNPKVAATLSSLSTFPTVSVNLQKLSDEDCQSLILHKAGSAAVNNPPKRKHCGRSALEVTTLEIAEKFCKGLPLVANIIGHQMLSFKPEVNRWPSMLLVCKDLWDLPEFREQIFPAFRLNYSDLSDFLKNCFPYFSLFPDNHNFRKDELVRLWWAEGFIKPQVAGVQLWGNPGLEELGSCYFDEVLSRSILQIYHPLDQAPQIYRMHEFIHRYAQYIGSDMYLQIDEQFCYAGNMSCMPASASFKNGFRNARHLSFLCPSIPPQVWKDIEKCEGLRTILSLHEHTHIGQVSYTLFLKLQSLRVLNLSGTDINELPESIGKLKHLRLLDVSKTDIEELPSATADLYVLQILKLDHCPLLLQLPKDTNKLIHLLHLEVDIKGLTSMPPAIGNLCNLHTLRAFIVGRKDGYHITELRNMKQLKGSICLTNLENIKDGLEAKEAMLSNKPFLKRLELEWNNYSTDGSRAERILTGLEPHENLEELQVTGYDSWRFPSWLSSTDCKLTTIHLVRCDRCSILPALGKLQNLKALYIEEMHSVKCINNQFFGSVTGEGFPSLESLKFYDMLTLEKWEGLQPTHMPRLRDLVIEDCPNLVALPSLKLLISLVKLEINSCPMLQALPEEGLPFSLQTLIIVRSNLLKQRCLSWQGADWEKIKAVPKVVLDFVQVSTPARKG